LRICLVAADLPINYDIGVVKTRAQVLAHEGHDVTVLITAADESKEQCAANLVSEKAGVPPYSVLLVMPDNDVAHLSRFEAASPATKKTTALGVAIWRTVFELHSRNSFDLIEGESSCGALALTAFANIAPVVVQLDPSAAIFKKPKSIFESLSFDEQVCAMFERMAIGWCSAVVVKEPQLQVLIAEEMGRIAPQILIDRGDVPGSLSNHYKDIVSNWQGRKKSIYLKPIQSLCPDALMMFQAFDQMLYNYLYQNSWRFRLYHWQQMYRNKPAQFRSKLTLAALRPLVAATKNTKLSGKLSELEMASHTW
jgi:hypothetical protein